MSCIRGLFLLALLAGCGEFETRSIVLDMRVLAVSVEPPELIVPFDPQNPPGQIGDLEIGDAEVCALVADPADSRSLTYELRACAPTRSRRCDEPDAPVANLARADVEDPEEAEQPVRMCGTLAAGLELFLVLQDALEKDALSGFGGVEAQIELSVLPTGAERTEASVAYAAKAMLYSPELPAGRVGNRNPGLEQLTATMPDGTQIAAPMGRCNDIEPLVVKPGESIELEPAEREDAREDYVVPTLDNQVRMFTENLTYSWYATHGAWQREVTGGTRDVAGNEPPLDSTWTAPGDAALIGDGLDVRIWLVQRDERGGLRWHETCARVVP